MPFWQVTGSIIYGTIYLDPGMAGRPGKDKMIMSPGGIRLQAAAVPPEAVAKVSEVLKDQGIPVRQSSIILFAIGTVIGLTGDQLKTFALPKRGPKNRTP